MADMLLMQLGRESHIIKHAHYRETNISGYYLRRYGAADTANSAGGSGEVLTRLCSAIVAYCQGLQIQGMKLQVLQCLQLHPDCSSVLCPQG